LVAGHDDTALPDASAAEADRTLTRLGTSVLGRFNGNVVAHRRTVLDQTPGQTDHALITEAAAVAARPRDTETSSISMPTSATTRST
jgi:hypothetical protein